MSRPSSPAASASDFRTACAAAGSSAAPSYSNSLIDGFVPSISRPLCARFVLKLRPSHRGWWEGQGLGAHSRVLLRGTVQHRTCAPTLCTHHMRPPCAPTMCTPTVTASFCCNPAPCWPPVCSIGKRRRGQPLGTGPHGVIEKLRSCSRTVAVESLRQLGLGA